MKLAAGILKHGFRKWYEHQLLRSHAHMALTFVCLIGVLAAFEAITNAHGWTDGIGDAVTLLLCGATGLWGLRRYLHLLTHANTVASQADCPACGAYGRFKLLQARTDPSGDHDLVACRSCAHQWTIDS
ncbi:MAG: hypothetical protein ABIR94_21020 [Rubrivivax sp.]